MLIAALAEAVSVCWGSNGRIGVGGRGFGGIMGSGIGLGVGEGLGGRGVSADHVIAERVVIGKQDYLSQVGSLIRSRE